MDFREYIDSRNSISLVAEEKGELVGFVLGEACRRDEAECYFDDFNKIPHNIE